MRADTSDFTSQIAALGKALDPLGGQFTDLGTAAFGLVGPFSDLQSQGNELAGAVADVGASVAAQVEPFTEAGDAAAEAAGFYSEAGDSESYYAGQAEEASKAAQESADAMKHAGESAHEASEGVGDLLKELMGFAGIGLSLEALREFTIEAVHLFAETEKTGFVLGRLTGNAAQAAETIEELKATAVRLAVPFEDLLGMQVRLTNFGVSIQGIRGAVQAAADAAAGTKAPFSATEGALERIAETGMASGRILRRLGIESKDLAAAMGISADEVQKAFKDTGLTIEERVAYLREAIEGKKGLTGLAEDAANLTGGALDRFKIKWQLTMEEVGKAIGPAVAEYLPRLTNALKDLVIAGDFVVTGLPEVVNVVVGLTTVVVEAVKTYGKVWFEAMKGPFGNVASAAKEGFDNIKAASKATWDAITSDAKAGADVLDKLTAAAATPPGTEKPGKPAPYKGKPGSQYAAQKIEIDDEAAHQKALLEQKRVAYEADAKARGLSQEQMLGQLMEFNAEELLITAAAIKRKLDLQKGAKEEEKDLTLGAQLQAAEDKQASDDVKLQAKVTGETEKQFDERVKAHVQALNADLKFQEEVAEHVRKLNEELSADRIKTDEETVRGDMTHQMARLENQRAVAAVMLSEHRVTGQEKLAIDRAIDDQEDALEKRSIENQIALLELRGKAETDYGAKRQALLNQLRAMEDKISGKAVIRDIEDQTAAYRTLGITSVEALANQAKEATAALEKLRQMGATANEIHEGSLRQIEAEQKLAEARGEATGKYIVQATNIQAHMEAIRTQSQGLANIYVGFMKDVDGAFGHLSSGIVDAITKTKTLGAAAKDVAKGMATDILNTVIGGALKMLSAHITGLIADWVGLGAVEKTTAATTAAAVEATASMSDLLQVAGNAAVAASAAAASYAAIPFIGPAAAVAAGEAMYAAVMGAFGPLAVFDQGGLSKDHVLSMIEPEEMVLPPDISAGMRGLIKQGGAVAGNASGAPMFAHCTFTGVTEQLVNDVFSRGVRQLRLSNARI